MRSKQYFTSIKNNPHEISTDPEDLLLERKRREKREFGYKKYPECFYNKSIQDIFYLVFIDMTNELNLLLYRICVNDTHLNSLIFIG